MIYTSYFSIQGSNPKAVSIARRTPPGFKGSRYETLAPSSALLWWYLKQKTRLPRQELERRYTEVYTREVLDRLNPTQVLTDLGDGAVLLCYEKSGDFCHRQLVAAWLHRTLGIEVVEITKKGDLHATNTMEGVEGKPSNLTTSGTSDQTCDPPSDR